LSANGSNPFHPSRRPLAAILPLFLRRVQLPIPLGLNLLLVPGEPNFDAAMLAGMLLLLLVLGNA
jgi:hypothetical protein